MERRARWGTQNPQNSPKFATGALGLGGGSDGSSRTLSAAGARKLGLGGITQLPRYLPLHCTTVIPSDSKRASVEEHVNKSWL